jgi:signal transduction histidine kinase
MSSPEKIPEKILVVDDDRTVRADLARMLEQQGLEPLEAADAESALTVTRREAPGGAILDVLLPGADGVTLLGWLKTIDPDLSVVMLTGQGDVRTAVACLTKGADAFLIKPVQELEVVAVLKRSLERRRLVIENRRYQSELETMVKQRTAELERATLRLRELDQLKSEFVSRVSHELRSPLTVMHTTLAVLLERMAGPITAQQDELLAACQTNIDRLARLVDNVLDLSRIESGRMELCPDEVDPSEVIRSVVNYYQPIARERDVDLGVELAGAGAEPLWADPDKMQQVLMNLVDNAIKFTPRGGRVRVSARPSGSVCRFAVTDTGVGVSEGEREKIFEPFVQGRPAVGCKQRGAGLGLAIARTLVELHGGSLELASEEGKGTTFAFTIPRGRRSAA